MGLQRLMSMQRDQQRRRRKILARKLVASANKQKGFPCQPDGDGDLQAGETTRCSIPDLPEITNDPMEHESIVGHSSQSHLRRMAEDHHCHLKNVEITGFSSAKSLVELTCYILKNTVLLECLIFDTLYPYGSRCSDERSEWCILMCNSILRKARRAFMAIRRYIEDKVPVKS